MGTLEWTHKQHQERLMLGTSEETRYSRGLDVVVDDSGVLVKELDGCF